MTQDQELDSVSSCELQGPEQTKLSECPSPVPTQKTHRYIKKIKYVLNVTNAAKPNHAWTELISDQVLFYKYDYGFTATSSTETNNTDENYNSRQLHYILSAVTTHNTHSNSAFVELAF